MSHTGVRICAGAALAGALVLPGCSTTAPAPTPTSTTSVVTSETPSATTQTTITAAAPVLRNWFDLHVGDCLTELPQIDLGEVSVELVDCGQAHAAEVFLRAPLEVNTAVADVANRQCTAGFSRYTGRPAGGPYAVTYLIDSNQDRTSNNPYPSTVICLLQSSTGQPLTGSPRA